MRILFPLLFLFSFNIYSQGVRKSGDYTHYHQQIRKAQELIAGQEFAKALPVFQAVFDSYDFLFLKDCKMATQVALHAGEMETALHFTKLGFKNGWELKSAQKEKWLKPLQNHPSWKRTVAEYPALRSTYLARINPDIREVVQKMFRKDQRKALGALFTFTSAAHDRYAEKKFAPHSRKQMEKLIGMMKTCGYPGEQLIGTETWASVILAHHNSITENHTLADTLYPFIRPQLLNAIRKGQMNPYEFAFIEDWYVAVRSGHKEKAFGILHKDLTQQEAIEANKLREELGLRSLETQHKLADIQRLTGIDFYIRRVR